MNTELYHYGVLGMKWGRRKQYYSETKNKKSRLTLTDKQKKVIKIGAAVAGVGLATYGAYKLGESGKLDSLINIGKQKSTDLGSIDIDSKSGLKKFSSLESIESSAKNTNPSKSDKNCSGCSIANAFRMFGFNATAKSVIPKENMNIESMAKVFGISEFDERRINRVVSPNVEKIQNRILKRSQDGDIGAISVTWSDSYCKSPNIKTGGHVLNWVVKNGEVIFSDGQPGLTGNPIKNFLSKNISSQKESTILRIGNISEGLNLDNVNFEELKKYVDF